MRRYHLDCSSGLSGDMFLGACLDLGMPLAVLSDAVARLALEGITVEARPARRGGLTGVRFRVCENGRPIEGPDPDEQSVHEEGHSHGAHHHGQLGHSHGHGRSLADIRLLLDRSALEARVRERAHQLFTRLGAAEAKAHGVPVEQVHFHEVGAVDSIVDLVGAATAHAFLDPESISCGPVNVGGGTVATQHGALPVPAPATAELLRGIPIYGSPHGELLTPTGAVLLAEMVDEFREVPPIAIEAIGYGLGKREIAGRPNAARILAGRASADPRAAVEVVECEIDDLPGEGFGFLLERLLAAGALDVFFTSVQMKKNRPGTLVTLLCRRDQLEPLAGLLLAESGSLGCRFHTASRFEAEREIAVVATPYGDVRVKRARFAGRPLAETPEFEDCRRLALEHSVPWREVHAAALLALAAQRSGR
jgi:uncharacterized protein (TIGR00299 family) protein